MARSLPAYTFAKLKTIMAPYLVGSSNKMSDKLLCQLIVYQGAAQNICGGEEFYLDFELAQSCSWISLFILSVQLDAEA